MSLGNSQKTPFAESIQRFAEAKWNSLIELEGKALPASITKVGANGTIVTVKLEVTTKYTIPVLTIPIAGSQYIRLPVQVGDKGVVFPCDTSIGNVTGLGPTTVDLTKSANLSSLVFFPVGNSSFANAMNANRIELYGPDGAIIHSANKQFIVQVTQSEIDIQKADGTVSIKIDAAGVHGTGLLDWNGNFQLNGSILGSSGGAYAGTFHTTGAIVADGGVSSGSIALTTHLHTSGSPGSNTSGPHP